MGNEQIFWMEVAWGDAGVPFSLFYCYREFYYGVFVLLYSRGFFDVDVCF